MSESSRSKKATLQASREKSQDSVDPGLNPDLATFTPWSLERIIVFAESLFSPPTLSQVSQKTRAVTHLKLLTQADTALPALPSDAGDLAKVIALITFGCCDKTPYQKQLMGDRVLAYSASGRVHHGRRGMAVGMAAGSWSRKPRDDIFNSRHKTEGVGKMKN